MSTLHNIVLIGGTGFIGSYVTRLLAARDDVQVFVIHSDIGVTNPLRGVTYHACDLLAPDNSVRNILQAVDYLVIMIQPNAVVIRNVISMITASRIKKIIYTSTLLVYPDAGSPQTETTVPDPQSVYEQGKFQEEQLLTDVAKIGQVQITIARLGNVYGDVKNRGIVGLIMAAFRDGTKLTINGDGSQRRDYIFVEDVARLLTFLVFYDQQLSCEVFNVCRNTSHTITEVIHLSEQVAHKTLDVIHGSAVPEKNSVVGNNQKIVAIAGDQLQHDLQTGLEKTYHQYLPYA